MCDKSLLTNFGRPLLLLVAKKLAQSPQNYDEKAASKFINKENLGLLREFLELLNEKNSTNSAQNSSNSALNERNLQNSSDFENLINDFLAQRNLELKHLAQALRLALTGSGVSPGIYEVLEFLGVSEAKRRIEKMLSVYENKI